MILQATAAKSKCTPVRTFRSSYRIFDALGRYSFSRAGRCAPGANKHLLLLWVNSCPRWQKTYFRHQAIVGKLECIIRKIQVKLQPLVNIKPPPPKACINLIVECGMKVWSFASSTPRSANQTVCLSCSQRSTGPSTTKLGIWNAGHNLGSSWCARNGWDDQNERPLRNLFFCGGPRGYSYWDS